MPNIITLDNNSPSIQHLCKVDERLAKVINMVGPITYSPYESEAYAFLLHEIIEQMLSTKAAKKIYGRLEEKCNYQITPETINDLSAQDLRDIGTSSSKAGYIRNVTTAVIHGDLDLSSLSALSDEAVISKLTKFSGIGMWTAKMYLIFVLNRSDILP